MVTTNIREGLIILYLSIVQYVWCCIETINLSQDHDSTFITSPNFGTNQLYPLNINCKWNIKAPNKTNIFLVFHSFDLEYNQYCSWDYVSIQDGVCDTSGNRYCGSIIPPTFQTNSGHVCLQFRSDVVIAKKGFNATVYISKAEIEDPLSTISLAPCLSTPYVINSTTIITSPNFQIQQNYPNNAHCEWLIMPNEMSVTIQFKAFDVENHPYCGYDSLKFYNGSTKTSLVLSTYCGAEIPKPLTVNSTTFVVFSSDFIVPKSGFKALITFLNSETTIAPFVSSTKDSIESTTSTTTKLNTPEVAPNFHTNLMITLPTSTNKNPTTSPSNAGPNSGSSAISELSTVGTEVVTEKATTKITIKQASTLLSDSVTTSQIPNVPMTYEMCSQSMVKVPEEVFVQSPNYGFQYPLNINCMLIFSADFGEIVTVDFKEMDVEKHYRCKWDKVIVYDGNSSSDPILDTICGQRKPVLNSTSNSLTIHFISDHVVQLKGFKAAVRAIGDTSLSAVTLTGSSATTTESSTNFGLLSTSSLDSTTFSSTTSLDTSASSSPTHASSSELSTNSPVPSTSATYVSSSSSALPTSSPASSSTLTSSSASSTNSRVSSTSATSVSTSPSALSTNSPVSSTSATSVSTSSSALPTSSPASSSTITRSSASSTNSPVLSTSATSVSTSFSALPTSSPASSSTITSSSASSTNSPVSLTSATPESTSSLALPTSSPASSSTITSSSASSPNSPVSSTSTTSVSTSSSALPTSSPGSSSTITSSSPSPTNSPVSSTSATPVSTSSSALPTGSQAASSSITISTNLSTETSAPTSSFTTTSTSSVTQTTSSVTQSTSSSVASEGLSQANPVSPTQLSSLPSGGPVSICDQTHLYIYETLLLVSPNYGQGQQYPVNVDCGLSLSTNSNQYFSITFEDFELEEQLNCGWDYLVVHDGDMTNGSQLEKLCGILKNHTIEFETNQLFLKFYSDSIIPKAGFLAIIKVKTINVTETTNSYISTTMETVVKSSVSSTSSTTEILTTPNPQIDILASACAGIPMVITTSSSDIESPGYSESTTYPNDMDCQWAIEAPVDKIILLFFVSFDVEHQDLCEWDSLSVYDGATSLPDLLIGNYCGKVKPSNITSTGKTMYLKFTTDRIIGKQGFKIEVMFINSTKDASNNCEFDWLPCGSNGKCIPKEWFCDGEQDCFYNEDENNCDSCRGDEIACHDGSCLPQYQRCDGIPQCTDAEDEDDCTTISTDGRLLVMKSSKWFPVCHDQMWSNESAHIACIALGHPGYVASGSKNTTEKTYAVLSSSLIDFSTDFSNHFSLSSSCFAGQTVTLQCQEKICGIVSESIPQAFIVGGSQSAVGEWPWVVAVMSGDKNICGGTIISDQWILTAGHCIDSIQTSPQTTSIIAGATNLKAKDVQYRKVSEMIPHPKYEFIYLADLGLMRLRQPLVFSSTIKPLCLPTRLHTWSSSLPCYIAGWGATSLQDAALQETDNNLHHAKVKVWPKSKCESAYPNKTKESMVCAGYEYGHIDACKGDSGGPLMCKVGRENDWVFVGITSWGEGCGGINKPGVYTKVDYYRQWVQQMTKRTDKSIDCNFETPDICGYMDQSNSTLMWARRSGAMNGPPRPLTDATLKSKQGSFMYAFIPHNERGNSATLISPQLDLTGEHCLTFWFNFHGNTDAVFTVHGIQSDNTTLSLVQFSKISLGWRQAEVDLTTNIRGILFKVQSFLKYDGGVALDDINVSNTSCVGVTKLKCNFDGGTLCNYQQAEDDSDDWQIKVHLLSDTNSRAASTPKDHYLEVNGANRFPGILVKLLSPTLNSTVPKCLSFKYKISPIHSHTLSVCTVTQYDGNSYSNCQYWMKSSSANNTWTLASAEIPPLYQLFQIGFQAKRGSFSGIVAVDDITRIDGNCS